MQIIVDSGGTKADWSIVSNGQKIAAFKSKGFQPFVQSKEEMKDLLQDIVEQHNSLSTAERIYYYGTGCSDREQQEYLKSLMKPFFPNAQIRVRGDLYGAALACCGLEEGIVGILGTGSNSCKFDGKRITENVPSLGFILGDDGSGVSIGKKLIKDYFYDGMPEDLRAAFEKLIPGHRQELLDKLYRQQKPNAYLASFARFAGDNRTEPYITNLVKDRFRIFVRNQIKKYTSSPNNSVHFVGSIAFYWRNELAEVLEEEGFTLGKLISAPIDALTHFHLNFELEENDRLD